MTYGRNVQTLNGVCQTFSSRATFGTLPHKIGSVNKFFFFFFSTTLCFVLTLVWPSDAVMFAALVLISTHITQLRFGSIPKNKKEKGV